MNRSFKQRMEALERARWARLTPLERGEEYAERGTPVRQWPDDVLDAYADAYCMHLRSLSDAELDAIDAK